MIYHADLHIHTDMDEERGRWHGSAPQKVAEALVGTTLDIAGILEHDYSLRNARTRFGRFFEVQDCYEQIKGDRKTLKLLFGMEITVMFGGQTYHAGYIYEDQNQYGRGNLPEIPETRIDLEKLVKQYQIDFPGLVIIEHPSWQDYKRDRRREITQELLQSELIDGVEVLNGAMIVNGSKVIASRRGLYLTEQGASHFLKAKEGRQRLAPIGSSDDHRASLIGSAVTEFEGEQPEDIFGAIKQGRTHAVAISEAVKEKTIALQRNVPGIDAYVR